MIDPATLDYYTKRAPFFTQSGAQGHSRDLDAFLDRLDPGAAVLELGCGGGHDANRMRERGFAIEATDGIEAMVRKANERFDLGARVLRFDELAERARYDAIWAHATLLHCPRAELPDALARIHRALKPGGLHYASYKLGDGEGRDLLGRLHNFPSRDWILARYRGGGLRLCRSPRPPRHGLRWHPARLDSYHGAQRRVSAFPTRRRYAQRLPMAKRLKSLRDKAALFALGPCNTWSMSSLAVSPSHPLPPPFHPDGVPVGSGWKGGGSGWLGCGDQTQ